MVHITKTLSIDDDELAYTFARSGGPGGQNVNKVSTRATLTFDVGASESLSPVQKARIRRCLPGRINRDGVLRVVASRHRTQAANRRAALERFIELLAEVLTPTKPRRPTRPTRASRERRLTDKRRQSMKKQDRRSRPDS